MALSCRHRSPGPALKERGPALRPGLLLSGLFCLGQHDQRAGQFIGAKCICPGGDDQFTKLLHLAALEIARLISKRLRRADVRLAV